MAYQIEFAPRARRDLKKLPADVRHRIAPHIDALAQNPRPPGVVKLSAEEDKYRIRVGSYRVVYEIRDAVLLVTIVKVKSRGDVYR